MCGIVGIVGRPPEDPGVIARMTALLRHRGPDDSGVWRSPGAHLGHTRLAILDLSSAGHQPMHLEELALTYNGEIYNFHELRAGLAGPFRSRTDSEVILHAYRERGAKCVHGFHGMFAFAIWDERRRRLFAARDRLGIKPLYYRPLAGALAFASEVAPLLELGRPEIDDEALSDYLTYSYVPTPRTPWKGIFKLGPAQTLVWQEDALRLDRYWRPEPRCSVADLAAATAQLDELLAGIVPEHSLADVPVGVFLSGGIDSATVTAYLDRPRTFTLGQPEAARSEAAAARRVAVHLGTRHTEETAEVADLAGAVDELVEVFGEPFGDSAALAVWLVSRFTSEHVKVALSGEGGDEIFCGYRWYGRAMSAPAPAWRRLSAALLPTFTLAGRSAQRRGCADLERYASFLGLFTPAQKRALAGPRLAAGADDLWHFRRHWRPELPFHQRLQWADLYTYLPDGMLTKVDRASMAFSLEVRPPLLDHRLVEWALTLDAALQRDAATDRGKLVLRRLMAGRLPPGHLERPKRGFNLAIRRWARANPGLLAGALGRLAANGIIRRPRPFSPTNEQTWALLVLDRWLRRHDGAYAS
ncbi:MAG: asparagine synthase (glutamine-hydrolyzing) [Acidobacteriota bacterium]|nr:asparagine synthase (glutamine-hydrolyzing) [Acidobacteriota bacterium]MDH3522666.1 asparagine synthase (glutamine-hydrolyzing) [Acidobacteriota bacterium]